MGLLFDASSILWRSGGFEKILADAGQTISPPPLGRPADRSMLAFVLQALKEPTLHSSGQMYGGRAG